MSHIYHRVALKVPIENWASGLKQGIKILIHGEMEAIIRNGKT